MDTSVNMNSSSEDVEYPPALLAMLGALDKLGGWKEDGKAKLLEVIMPSQFSPAPEVMAKQMDLLEQILFDQMHGGDYAIERVLAVQNDALHSVFSDTIIAFDDKALSIPKNDHSHDWMYHHLQQYAANFQPSTTATTTTTTTNTTTNTATAVQGSVGQEYGVLVPVLLGCSKSTATEIAKNGFQVAEQNGDLGTGIYTTTDAELAFQQGKGWVVLAWAVFSNVTTDASKKESTHDAVYTVLDNHHHPQHRHHHNNATNGHSSTNRKQGVLVLSSHCQLFPVYILMLRPLSEFPFPHLEQELRLGWKQFWNYQTDEALALAAKLAAQEPLCGMAFLLHGRCLKRQLKHDEGEKSLKIAVSVLTRHLNQYPDDMVAYKTRALAYYLLARDFDSYSDAAKAIEADRNDASAYLVRGETCRMMSDYEKALDDCSRAIQLNPNFPNAYFTRAETNRMKGKYAESVKDATHAILLNPSYARAYRVRGDSYRLLNKYDQALEDATKAVELDPSYANAFWTRAESFRNLGCLDECIQDSTTAIELNPNDAFVYETRGYAYKLKGMMAEARLDLKQALKLKPGEDFARHHLDDIPEREKRWAYLRNDAAKIQGTTCQISDCWVSPDEIYYITKIILPPETTTLNLQDNEVGDMGARMLCNSTTITTLNLNNNEITDQGALFLASSTVLTSLELASNSIGDDGALAFSRNTHLLTLNLNGNYVGDTGAKSFHHSTTITELDIRDCAVDDEVMTEIENHVKENKQAMIETTNRFSAIVTLLANIRSKKLASLRASANALRMSGLSLSG